MTIIGISLTHDGTLTVLKDGVNVFSIGEERLNRRKAYIGFPFEALRYVVEKRIVEPAEVAVVAVSSGTFKKEWAWSYAFELTEDKTYYDIQNNKAPADFSMQDEEWKNVRTDRECEAYVERKVRGLLDAVGIHAPIQFYDHHSCHAAAAYHASGKNEVLTVTLDGEGDLASGTIGIGNAGDMEIIHRLPVHASIGYLYSEVTRRCGFKMSRHEGKITGLAAYGDPKKSMVAFDRAVRVENGSIRFPMASGIAVAPSLPYRLMAKLGLRPYAVNLWQAILNEAGPLSKEDLSAGVQWVLEEKVTEFVQYWVARTGIKDVVVAGGVFANVKLNQRVAELKDVRSLFVYPDMGDGGNAYGAAMLAYRRAGGTFVPARMQHAYLGPEFTNEEIEAELATHPDIAYERSANAPHDAARLIADKKIVGWFQGRMEYGPRALGNRSVLAHPEDATINKWLNDRMKRTEFMPFAPSCLAEAADELFEIDKETMKVPAEFMTITFRMKDEWAKRAPAVAHVDQTARPQLVRAEVNPRYHALITRYHELTGLPLLINTSFNVHEEPIVCHPREAIASLKNGMVDVLVMGDVIARMK